MSAGITNPSEKYFKDGLWTFDGTVWRPQGQLLAYRKTYHEYLFNTDAIAGTNLLDGTPVPTGEVWVVTSVVCYNITTATSYTSIRKLVGGVGYVVYTSSYDAMMQVSRFSGQIVLAAGEKMRAQFGACVVGDDLAAYFLGYKFLVAE